MELHEEARELQRRFESFREERMIPRLDLASYSCDDIVGRYCIVYDDIGGIEAAEEPVQFAMARVRILEDLARIGRRIPGDLWVLRMRFYYMAEVGRWNDAVELAEECGGREHWWCDALLGHARHRTGDWVGAQESFDRALAAMPDEIRERWTSGEYLLRPDLREALEAASDPEAWWRRFWVLADPLYLVEGNDRRTEHLARQTYADIFRDAAIPGGYPFGEDTAELRTRFGEPVGFARSRRPVTGLTTQDTRGLWSMGDPRSRELVPPPGAVLGIDEFRPGSWRTDADRNWTSYLVPYAPDFGHLDTQVARFRRGDSLLVVGGFAEEDTLRRSRATGPRRLSMNPTGIIPLRDDTGGDRADRQRRANNPFARTTEEPEPFFEEEAETEEDSPVVSAIVLLDEATYERHEVRGEGPQGVYRLRVPNGRYIMSVEAWDSVGGRAWRDRHGIGQGDLPLGLAAMSDILVLRDQPELPESLDEALPQTLPVARIAPGESFQIGWEMYGLQIAEAARVTIGVNPAEEGFVRRLGEFLRLVEPTTPVDLSFQDRGPDRLGTVFRAVRLNLPELEPGAYTITVEIELPGREPIATSRTLEVVQ